MFILISFVSNLLRFYPKEKIEIKGEKDLVLISISNYVHKCLEENRGKKGSFICFTIYFVSNEEISSTDIKNSLEKRIDISKLNSEDLGISGEILIRYENGIIYIEKIKYERISS